MTKNQGAKEENRHGHFKERKVQVLALDLAVVILANRPHLLCVQYFTCLTLLPLEVLGNCLLLFDSPPSLPFFAFRLTVFLEITSPLPSIQLLQYRLAATPTWSTQLLSPLPSPASPMPMPSLAVRDVQTSAQRQLLPIWTQLCVQVSLKIATTFLELLTIRPRGECNPDLGVLFHRQRITASIQCSSYCHNDSDSK